VKIGFRPVIEVAIVVSLIAGQFIGIGARDDVTPRVVAQHCRDTAPQVLHRAFPKTHVGNGLNWIVARVTLTPSGQVEATRLMRHSGDATFVGSALQALSETAFVPASRSCVAIPATFDFALKATARGSTVVEILQPKPLVIGRR